MKIASTLCLASLLLVKDGASERYPTEAPAAHVHYFILEGEPSMPKLREALSKLGEDAEILYGPHTSSAAPKDHFIAVSVPMEVETKDLLKALKKGKAKPVELAWTLARWSLENPPPIPQEFGSGDGSDRMRSLVIGQHNDIAWFEAKADHVLFFYVPGKLDGAWILDRLVKGMGPYMGPDFGIEMISDLIAWPLAEAPSEKKAKKTLKALGKLPGVTAVEFIPEGASIELRVRLDAHLGSGPHAPVRLAGEEEEEDFDPGIAAIGEDGFPDRPTWETTPARELLAKGGFVLPAETTDG